MAYNKDGLCIAHRNTKFRPQGKAVNMGSSTRTNDFHMSCECEGASQKEENSHEIIARYAISVDVTQLGVPSCIHVARS